MYSFLSSNSINLDLNEKDKLLKETILDEKDYHLKK